MLDDLAPRPPVKKATPKAAAKPAPAPAPRPVAPAALPATVATRSYIGGPWEAFVEGQVPGPNGVIAIKFADGSEWNVGYGWLNK